MGVALGKRAGNIFSGAASGAATGSIFGAPGAIVGGIGGALIGGFSKSDEELAAEARNRRRENYDAFKRSIEERRQKSLTEGTQKIGRLTSGLTSRFRDSAARRAAAMGRVGDVESFELPVVSQVAKQGSESMSNFITDTNQSFDRQAMAADAGFLESENQYANDMQSAPTALDYLGEIAPAALNYTQNQNYLDVLKEGYANKVDPNVVKNIGNNVTTIPGSSITTLPSASGYPPLPPGVDMQDVYFNYRIGQWEPK